MLKLTQPRDQSVTPSLNHQSLWKSVYSWICWGVVAGICLCENRSESDMQCCTKNLLLVTTRLPWLLVVCMEKNNLQIIHSGSEMETVSLQRKSCTFTTTAVMHNFYSEVKPSLFPVSKKRWQRVMRVSIGDRGILPATKAITWWVLDQNPLCDEVACYCTKFSNYINYYYIVTFITKVPSRNTHLSLATSGCRVDH